MAQWLTPALLTLLSFILATISALLLQDRASKTRLLNELIKRVDSLSTQLTVVTTQVSPLWARVQNQIINELHHPHIRYREMDGLLEKLYKLEITVDERIRLKEMLFTRSKDMHEDISESQRQSAKIMIDVMDKVILEAKETT